MNELEFKHHLKDLAAGHHHPEEHDWDEQAGGPKLAPAKKAAAKGASAKSAARKTSKKK